MDELFELDFGTDVTTVILSYSVSHTACHPCFPAAAENCLILAGIVISLLLMKSRKKHFGCFYFAFFKRLAGKNLSEMTYFYVEWDVKLNFSQSILLRRLFCQCLVIMIMMWYGICAESAQPS